jgi:hypothetical protein
MGKVETHTINGERLRCVFTVMEPPAPLDRFTELRANTVQWAAGAGAGQHGHRLVGAGGNTRQHERALGSACTGRAGCSAAAKQAMNFAAT